MSVLILTRADGEAVRIGEDIVIQVISTDGGTARIGITAPKEVVVLRGELLESKSTDAPPAGAATAEPERPRRRLRLRRRPRSSQPA